MKSTTLFLLILSLLISQQIHSQTAIKTSFEQEEGYTPTIISGINNWTGDGMITTDPAYVKTGFQSLNLATTAAALQTNHIAFTENETGLTDDVYLDMWMNVKALNGQFTISANDLIPGSGLKKSFTVILTSGKQIKIYSGSSGTDEKAYELDNWFRLSSRIDYDEGTYQVAINGEIIDKIYNFRDNYNPSSLGRANGIKEYHSIQFSNSKATNNIAIDDLYIGNDPIADIPFIEANPPGEINIIQPENGKITLIPEKEVYEIGETVTANISTSTHYILKQWTGDLEGSENPKTFSVSKKMTIGAVVEVDPSNPPPTYKVSIEQPVGGTIILDPQQESYYEGSSVSATVTLDIGYEFEKWDGDIEGTDNPIKFSVKSNMSIGAAITEKTQTGTIKEVASVSDIKSALNEMLPGDEIVVADGEYALGGITLKSLGGTNSKPVIVRAKNLGKTKFTGKTSFTLNACQNITFQGFNFDIEHVSTIFKLEGSSYIRITQNEFRMDSKETQSSKWIIIGEVWKNEYCRSKYNRIDHNLFEGKYDSGPWVTLDGSHGSTPDISKYDRIDHNHFRYNQPRITNDKETLRIGVSDLSLLSAYCTIEYNLFEECDGDPEVISIKSCDNIIRGNTFRKSLGTLSLRHGFRNRVEGNFFFGEGKTDENGNGCGGIRVYGLDHIIVNNYFEDLTGSKWDAAITITNGDVLNSSSSLTSHFIPENIIVAFNTLINNKSNIEIGFDNNGKYGRAPKNCLIANNIVIDHQNPIIKSYSSTSLAEVKFENNIMYPTETSSIGISYKDEEIKVVDPKLIKTTNRIPENSNFAVPYAVYKLSAESVARNAAKGEINYLSVDFEGHTRKGIFDIGADEYSPDEPILYGPLGEDHVGINGSLEGYESGTDYILQNEFQNSLSVYPNPATDIVTIHADKSIDRIDIHTMSGEYLFTEKERTFSIKQLNSGVYILSVCFADGNNHRIKFIKK